VKGKSMEVQASIARHYGYGKDVGCRVEEESVTVPAKVCCCANAATAPTNAKDIPATNFIPFFISATPLDLNFLIWRLCNRNRKRRAVN